MGKVFTRRRIRWIFGGLLAQLFSREVFAFLLREELFSHEWVEKISGGIPVSTSAAESEPAAGKRPRGPENT